jgi:hypothetical protein
MRNLRLILLALASWSAPPLAAQAQAPPAPAEDLRALREEIARLREEVAALRKELREGLARPALPAGTAALWPAAMTSPAPAAARSAAKQDAPQDAPVPTPVELNTKIEMLQSQMAEQAQTKVESESRFPVRVFGAITSNLSANLPEGKRANDPEFPTISETNTGTSTPLGVNMRQTRLGATVEGPVVGGMRSSAVVAIDFFTGPRLLYAFARLAGERTAIEIGQDHTLFAPRNPTSLAMTALPQFFNSGNAYLRLPQFRIEHQRNIGEGGTWSLAAGIAAPRANGAYAPLQVRTGWRVRGTSGNELEVGASGWYGGLAGPVAGDAWGFAIDFDGRAGRFGLGGEMFVAQNVPQLGLAVGQYGRSAGGFIEGRWQATPRLDFNLGYGTDRVFEHRGLILLPETLAANSSAFGNFIFRLTPEFETSLEYRWLQSQPRAGNIRPNNHLNLVFVYRF